nr:restriction endonuclease [Armatimonadota bacterium]
KQMANLFEEFVRNFYKIEQDKYYVTREYVKWDAKALDEISSSYLPRMQTDISMESNSKKIIIETKFYKEALQTHYDIEKIRQDHLNQLFVYLKHLEKGGGLNLDCEGILLYPTVKKEIELNYESQGHKIGVRTINLNQEWRNIHNDLMSFIDVNSN